MAETINMPKLGFDMAEGLLVRWVKQEWLRTAEQRRFLLRAPSLTAPEIISAAQAEGEDVSDLARVLAAAVDAVSITVPEDLRHWIRERSRLREGS